jgi:hypothetical protein
MPDFSVDSCILSMRAAPEQAGTVCLMVLQPRGILNFF